jgi:glycosyltransferase involved in cell wall biosynthesis
MVVVHNGVGDIAAGSPDERLLAFARGRPLAGLVAVLRPQKDPLALVRAAGALAGERGCAAIVGDGALAGAVEAEIARSGLGDRVARFAYGGSMAPHLAALDVFVLPSAWEAFPIALLEAMQAGLPVLATRVGGVAEAVQDGVTGRLVDPGDDRALAAALAGLVADAPLRARMGAAARRVVAERYSLGAMVDGIEGVYAARISAAASTDGGRRATS